MDVDDDDHFQKVEDGRRLCGRLRRRLQLLVLRTLPLQSDIRSG